MSRARPAVRIRPASRTDVPGMLAIYAPVVAQTTVSYEEVPPDEEELARRLATTTERTPWIVGTEDGAAGERVLGYAYAGPFRARAAYRWTVESALYVHEATRGRGLGRALYLALLDLLRLQGFHLVVGGIALPNPVSERLHESLGFEPVGTFREVGWKLGGWRDVGFWQLRLATGAPTEREPRALADVLADPEARACLDAAAESVR